MNKIFSKLTLLTLSFNFILCLITSQAIGQTDTLNNFFCGTDAQYILKGAHSPTVSYPPPSVPVSFVDTAIVTCNKIDVYYEDINRHLHVGFDDTTPVVSSIGSTLGKVRQATYCAVLNYIQSVYDFEDIPATNHVRIYVDTSLSEIVHPSYLFGTILFEARAYPQYDTTHDGVTNGWISEFVNGTYGTGVDPSPGQYHGFMQVNFDRTYTMPAGVVLDSPMIPWQNDYSIPFNTATSCGKLDLFSTLLHETGHMMGWFSTLAVTNSLTPYSTISSHHVFTGLDWSMHVATNSYPLALTKLLSGPITNPVLDSTVTAFHANNNYWLNGGAAPDNVPVFSGGYPAGTTNSYFSHLDDQQLAYTERLRISPGDQQDYSIGPFGLLGVTRRKYSKGELESFVNILGYRLDSSFTTLNPYIYSNHIPFSKKMAGYSIPVGTFGYFTEEVTPDDTLTNNVGVSRTVVSITSMVASGAITDADAGDGSRIYVDSTTLVNFRGCGRNGNNHVLLHVSSDAKTITYTPRPGFYGRAQFGFNITDGKENGSFLVMTIDVKKGNNVSNALGANMVCNPAFEEGSEVKIDSIAESVPNATSTEDGLHEGKWGSIAFSDSHPYCFNSNFSGLHNFAGGSGTIIKNSDIACGISTASTSESGSISLSFPTDNFYYYDSASGVSTYFYYDNPLPKDTVGQRYQMYSKPGSSYYYLTDSLRHCNRYTLEFDYFRPIFVRYALFPLTIGFADHTVDLRTTLPDASFNFALSDTVNDSDAPGSRNWVHYSFHFSYCGNPSNILYIRSENYGTTAQFLLDNLSLKQDTTAPPRLTASITKDSIAPCTYKLTANATNPLCPVSYLWSSTSGSVLTDQSDTIFAGVTATYTVSVSDGCRDTSATTTITHTPLPAITGASSVCFFSNILLTEAATTGTWSSSNTGIASVAPDGYVYGVGTGTATISYTDGCGISVTKTITVNPLPAIIGGASAVCVGATTLLNDATAGGTWSSSNTAIASINSATGSVTGISAGAVFISYTLTATGCSTASTLFVRPLPAAITGNVPLCSGSSITLNDGTSGGTWSSSATVVATAGSGTGLVTGVASGTATIAYTLSATGCATSVIVTINPLPSAITGSASVCVGSTLALSDGVTGGSWSSSATGVATIGTTGMVTGVTTGTTAITCTLATGCLATKIISVNPLPTAIAGFTFLCGAGTTTTLTDLTTGGTWSSSATGVSTIGTTGMVTAVAAGAATITYTMATGCIATTTISVGVASGDLCAPCSILGNGVYTPAGIGGSITTDLPAGKYYIANDVTITNNVTMTDAVIFMAPNVHLYVAPKWSLTTKGSHLFSCSGNMWAGISLLSDGVQTGVLTLEGDAGLTSTLIEDAVVGVDIESPILPNSGAPLFLESANAVFNRDDTGIKIVDYSPPSASAYPFLIEYTAFTTRKLWSGSPSSWARYFDLVNLIPVGDYEAPFSVINYSYKACYNDDPILQTVGVYLSGIGSGTYPDYAGIVVGDSLHSAANLFDTLNFGIRAVDASVTVHNDIFTHMASQDYRDGSWQQDHGGVGVYASTTDGENYNLSVEAALNRTGAVVYKLPNYFYNCRMGVAGLNYFSIRGTESYMITTQRADGPRRNYGYNMQSGFYDLADLDSNTIINVANGIVFKAAAPWLTTAVMGNPGEIDINSNTIQATIPFGTLTNQYVDKPVWVENSIAWAYIIGVGLPPTAYTALHSDGNTISDAYNGIYVSGIGPQKVTSDGNTISMIEYPGASTQQYGVYHAACMNDDIGRNVITGTNYKNDNWNGVLVWSSSTHNVTCNEVNTVGRGCEIDGTTLTSAFGANTMTNNGKGFLLGGVIGQQGNNLFPSFNRWEQTGGFTWNLAFPQTYTQFGADPNASPLWVYPGIATDPAANRNSTSNCGATYGCDIGTGITSGSGNGLVVGSYPISYEALNCDIAHNGNKPPEQQMALMVRQLIPTPRPWLDYWMSQHALWELMVQNDTLGDTSAALNAFRAMAVHSRFWLLHEIEHKIAHGDLTGAQTQLDGYSVDTLSNTQTDTATGVQMADNTDADVIVNNYRQFYQLYINYLENTLISSDSTQVEAIANLCPITNGEVVFKARALYNLIYDTLRLFPSNCSDSVGRIDSTAQRQSHITGITSSGDNIGQEYTLYPNPNDGNFELLQKVTDDASVKVEIWDAIGQSIYKYEAQFTNAMSKLHVRNVAPGLYLLQVTDSKGRIFRFKFVVE